MWGRNCANSAVPCPLIPKDCNAHAAHAFAKLERVLIPTAKKKYSNFVKAWYNSITHTSPIMPSKTGEQKHTSESMCINCSSMFSPYSPPFTSHFQSSFAPRFQPGYNRRSAHSLAALRRPGHSSNALATRWRIPGGLGDTWWYVVRW